MTSNERTLRNRVGEQLMSILAWIILGLISGFIASKIVNKTGEGVVRDIILGVVGAIIGGWLFTTFGMAGVTGVNLYSMLVAVVGAIVVLVLYHAITRRRTI
jgi:uncharacterized membrane protein YeaQ/YmgE (transglycosylase-associated protein family)